jgi:hypothetical protein
MIVPFYVRAAQKWGTCWGVAGKSPLKKKFKNSFFTHDGNKIQRELPTTLNQSLKAAVTATLQGCW